MREIARSAGIGAVFIATVAVAVGFTTLPTHRSGCHAVHSCPSDHHTYIWIDPATGSGWDCVEPGAPEYDPTLDITPITWQDLSYDCRSGGSPPPPPPGTTTTASAGTQCGVERWDVKTLSDPAASNVNFSPIPTTVDALRALPAPSVSSTTPRIKGAETSTYTLTGRLVEMKLEDDHDIHLVVADLVSGGTMIVEFPDPQCSGAVSSAHLADMSAARSALIGAEGAAGTAFHVLSGTATIIGVGFFDELHGQAGVAPNGVELHPVLSFSLSVPSTNQPPKLTLAKFTQAGHRPGGHYYVTERIRFRACDDAPGKLVAEVREKKGAGGQTSASSRRTRILPFRSGCANYTIGWRLAAKFFGAGTYAIALRVRDRSGAWSKTITHKRFTGG